jgi:muramoyltetrapeptide carboxypeptidase
VRPFLPPALGPGDRIGIAAPGGPIRAAAVDLGMAYLAGRGYSPVPAPHLRSRHGYLAGTDLERQRDLNSFLADGDLKAIWFARGGYGCARIVADLDLSPLRRRPKALIGYSDITVLHAAAQRALGLVTFHGPLVSELGDPAAFSETSLWRALSSGPGPLEYELDPGSVLRAGRGEGPLVGGCLSLLVSLVGTPYEPPTDGAILFWEDVNEEPFRIDRMLGQLRLAGRLARLRGMLVGRPVGCRSKEPGNDLPLAEILERHLEGTDYPVVLNVEAGHCPGKITLPLGRLARLDTTSARLSIPGA